MPQLRIYYNTHSSALPTMLYIITSSSTLLICAIHQLYVAQPDGLSTFSTLLKSNRIVNRKTTINIKYTKCTCHIYSLCSQHTQPFTEESTLLEYSIMFWRSLLPPSNVQSWNFNLYAIISKKTNLKQHHCGDFKLLFQCKAINNTTAMSNLGNYSHIFNEFHSTKFILV
jgi:hypothetical protein